ncbi:MAG: TetR/AcrR family transcriptional regulator [Tannerella sp.]|jgi:AcrR family transcriptional regulator|nr:TetR/AcrR family transcriptional regulator [Tannerella sp.]
MSLKEHIKDVSVELFARNGIRRVSMNDVAQKANVSKRTLYEFFSDKESLLIAVLNMLREPFFEYIESLEKKHYTALDVLLLFNEKLMERPSWICEDFFEDIKRYPNASRLLTGSKSIFLNKIIELLRRGVREDVFMSDVNYDILSLLFHERTSKREPSGIFAKYTNEEVHNTFFFILLRGICTDTGRDVLDRFLVKKRYEHDNV